MLKLPLLFYMVGYPGSGKTTFAGSFAARNKLVYLHADGLGFELFRRPTFAPDERKLIMKEMDRRAIAALQTGKSVVYDAGINTRQQRDHLRKLAQLGHTEAVGVWVQTPDVVAFKRLSKPRLIQDIRVVFDTGNPQAVRIFRRAVEAFEAPDDEALIVAISGSSPYEAQRDVVLSYVFPPRT